MDIEFDNVSMTYRPGIHALKNISFRINDGEFVFIIGRSGSGKSTLIKLLNCEELSTSGKVFIDDYDISYLKRSLVPYLRRNIGMIFQDFRLITSKTVYENVAFAMEIVGAKKSIINRRVPIVLSTVGLRKKANMHPNKLSGGEQQRIAIARAMVNNPALILADEPTGNLDPVNSEAVMALLQEINDNGTTVVVCTHDAAMVNKLKKRVIEISAGRLVRDDKLGEYNLSAEFLAIKKQKKCKDIIGADGKLLDKPAICQPSSPFVRNINLKFNELKFGLDSSLNDEKITETLHPSHDELKPKLKIEDDSNEIEKKKKIKHTPKKSISPEELEGESDSGTEEAVRIAVEYYMKKAAKYGENPKAESNEDCDNLDTDFINLIKPKRIDITENDEDNK